jgi:hypothetical protein
MKNYFLKVLAFLLVSAFALPNAQAVNVNFNLLNLGSGDQNKLEQTYANTYGYSPADVAPVMSAPATEVPSILQIAKSAATVPLTIWGLRKLGLSYMDILKMYTLPPSSLFSPNIPYGQFGSPIGQAWGYQQQYGNSWPSTIALADPVIMQLNQIKMFTDYMKVPYTRILNLPTDPLSFTHLVIQPWRAVLIPEPERIGWLPPGQAKKLGLWEPPGQAKKHWKEWDDDDQGDHHGHGHGHGRWKWDD